MANLEQFSKELQVCRNTFQQQSGPVGQAQIQLVAELLRGVPAASMFRAHVTVSWVGWEVSVFACRVVPRIPGF